MQLSICQKHDKKQKTIPRILSSSHVCLNRYCQNAYSILCQQCKNEHRDHLQKILSLEDILLLVKKLFKNPIVFSNKYILESIDIMKKIKLIKQFRRKIDILEKDMTKQAINFIEITQNLIHEYATSKSIITQLSQKVENINCNEMFQQFKNQCKKYFTNLSYNLQKEKIELATQTIKENQDKRKKSLETTKRKIEQVKDYSMKIIQVILNHDDESEDEQQFIQSINQKKKYYITLKEQLNLDPKQPNYQENDQDERHTKSTSVSGNIKHFQQLIEREMQTEDQWITGLKQEVVRLKQQFQTFKKNSIMIQNDQNQQIHNLQKEKQTLKSQICAMKFLLDSEKKMMRGFYKRLTQNNNKRIQVEQKKCEILKKIIEVHTTK